MSPVSVSESPSESVKLLAPLDALWFIVGHEYSARDLAMECGRCAAFIVPAFVGWHDVEVFMLPHAMGHKQYVCVPDC